MTTTKKVQSCFVGVHVQIPAYTDAWMMGDRYGTITKHVDGSETCTVTLDKSKKAKKFLLADCTDF